MSQVYYTIVLYVLFITTFLSPFSSKEVSVIETFKSHLEAWWCQKRMIDDETFFTL